MASRALGARHRPGVVSRAATRGSSRVVLLPVHFLFLRPFVLAKLLHLNDSRGKERERNGGTDAISRVRAGRQEREKTGLIFQRKERGHDSKPRSF